MKRLILSTLIGIIFAGSSVALDATQILQESGVKGGIIVHIGCDDPGLLAELRAGKAVSVHPISGNRGKL